MFSAEIKISHGISHCDVLGCESNRAELIGVHEQSNRFKISIDIGSTDLIKKAKNKSAKLILMDIDEIKRKKLKKLIEKMTKPVELSEKNFNRFISENENVVVDFWAEWCAPCRIIAPIIEELAKEYAGKVVFAKLNVNDAMDIATSLGISAIPTLVFFKRGKPIDAIVGVFPKSEIKRWIERNLLEGF